MRISLLAVFLTAAITCNAAGLGDRPVGPILAWEAESLAGFDADWLHLKFVEGSRVDLAVTPFGDVRFVDGRGGPLAAVNDLLGDALVVRRTFPGDKEKFRAWKAKGEAASGQAGPDLSLWYTVQVDGGRAELAATLNGLNALEAVEIAHPAPVSELASVVSGITTATPAVAPLAVWTSSMTLGDTPDFTNMQDYLFDTPVGMDAPSAWAVTGGRGAGMKFIDVELGWVHNHEDFDQKAQFYESELNNPSYRDHGTAVVGEVVGMVNGFGITGFASDVQWGTVAIDINAWPVVPEWFLEAAEALDPGDIWLIELQMFPPGRSATPMEYVQVNYDVIWTSSWVLDVVCVEAAGNGSQDLDLPHWEGIFDRNIRDSGAIMVAAGTPTGRIAEGFSNYGSRMDVHGWGSQITTTGYGGLYNGGSVTREYTSSFGGTSGASPMIVGSGLCLQGIALAKNGVPLLPVDLRTLLHDTGIPHLDQNREIGPRPDLGAAVDVLDQIPAILSGCFLTFGTTDNPPCDAGNLADDDDVDQILRSQFGFTAMERNLTEIVINGNGPGATSMGSINTRDSSDTTNVVAKVRARNYTTNAIDDLAQYGVISPSGDTAHSTFVNSADYVDANGDVEVRLRYVAPATFTPLGFTVGLDQVRVMVQ